MPLILIVPCYLESLFGIFLVSVGQTCIVIAPSPSMGQSENQRHFLQRSLGAELKITYENHSARNLCQEPQRGADTLDGRGPWRGESSLIINLINLFTACDSLFHSTR
jgi:hypothetical protein